jgi:hypothetical protein
MTILADTGGIIALLDSDDKHHTAIVRVTQNQELLVPATVLPEVDYLVNKYLGESVARSFWKLSLMATFTTCLSKSATLTEQQRLWLATKTFH